MCDPIRRTVPRFACAVTIGVRNVFDRDPPFTNQKASFQAGHDPIYAYPRGRFWYVTLKAGLR